MHTPYPTTAWSTRSNAKKERTKEGEERWNNGQGKKAKPSTPTLVIDALIGEKEQSGKQKEEQKKQTGCGSQPNYPGPFGHLYGPAWIKQWAYSEIPPPQQEE